MSSHSIENCCKLREQEYQKRLEVNRLRRDVYGQPDPTASEARMVELQAAEKELSELEKRRAEAQAQDPMSNGLILDTDDKETGLLGAESTGLEAVSYIYAWLRYPPRSVTCWTRMSTPWLPAECATPRPTAAFVACE